MTRRLSDWSEPGEKPPMVGVWETDYRAAKNKRAFQYWNESFWGVRCDTEYEAKEYGWISSCCNADKIRFRGLADKPE